MQTDLMRGALDFVEGAPFDVARRAPLETTADTPVGPPEPLSDRRPVRGAPDADVFPNDEESFGSRLRAVRERRRISIASIAESTKILGALLEGLENDDVSRWPTGLYRRAFMRAYATAIGLDPEPIVREFIARFPEPEDAPAAPAVPVTLPTTRAVLRLTLAEPIGVFAGGDLLRQARSRLMAVAADAIVLGAVGGALYLVVGDFWAPLAVSVVGYYFASIVVLGNTPGVCLVASRTASDPMLTGWLQTRRTTHRAWSALARAVNRARSSASSVWRGWLGRD
jgi:transcriptional regulator with XRE-family HTH domain